MNNGNLRVFWIIWCVLWALFWGFGLITWPLSVLSLLAILIPVGAEKRNPPGWYADPWQKADLRFWDGQAWTGAVK